MGFGFGSNPSPPVNTGFSFGQTNPPPQPPQNNLGFNLLGSQPVQPQQTLSQPVQNSAFQPIINNDPNKILAYDNTHLQILIDCIK